MTIVLKYGGNAMAEPDAPDAVLDEVAAFAARGDRVVVVHGGGPQIDAALHERGIAEPRVRGLRVTGAEARDVVEAVLGASVNKALVRALLRRGARAVGISGEDGFLVHARRAGTLDGVDLGYVGEVARVEPRLLHALLDADFTPVVAPLGVDAAARDALNVNADTVAGAIAGALGADAYVVLTNVSGVRRDRDDPATTIARLTIAQAQALLDDGTFGDGMIPKMLAAITAVRSGARRAVVAGAGTGAIAAALAGGGTELVA